MECDEDDVTMNDFLRGMKRLMAFFLIKKRRNIEKGYGKVDFIY